MSGSAVGVTDAVGVLVGVNVAVLESVGELERDDVDVVVEVLVEE